MEKKVFHLKGLNGIRAIAALSVVLSHTLMGVDYYGVKKVVDGWNFGSYGVVMFFTLSGFLITFLLLKEKESFNTIKIKNFYIRRVLRIWPLYYFYILLVVIVLALNFRDQLPGSLYYYLFMGANISAILNISLPFLTHYWSLGVEEQFYLFWPWLVKLFNPLKSILIFLVVFLLIKLGVRILLPQSLFYKFLYGTQFDCMAIGALTAILYHHNKKKFIAISFHLSTQLISWAIILLAAIGKLMIPDFINHDVFSIACAVLILNVAFNKNCLISLENKVFDFLGKISYGIYVYHVLIIYLLSLFLKNRLGAFNYILQLLLIIFLVAAVTIFIAWLSHKYFEKPFLNLKDKFSNFLNHAN